MSKSVIFQLSEGPPSDLDSIPLEKIVKICTLGLHCERMFNKSICVFKKQRGINKIIQNMSASEKELKSVDKGTPKKCKWRERRATLPIF